MRHKTFVGATAEVPARAQPCRAARRSTAVWTTERPGAVIDMPIGAPRSIDFVQHRNSISGNARCASPERSFMSLVSTTIAPFSATAYHDGAFVPVTHADLKGHWSVVFFYPADFTFVCPTELRDLADHYEDFRSLDVEIYAVSTDTHFTHKAWHDTSDTIAKVRYPMVGDPTGSITRNFDVMREGEGLADRATFLVDPDGVIQAVEVTAEGIGRSAAELLRKVRAAQYVATHPGEVCPARWDEGDATLTPSPDLVGRI
jgi:peroxiredoxin (alkyl hydroperoxide reductase subunit C)